MKIITQLDFTYTRLLGIRGLVERGQFAHLDQTVNFNKLPLLGEEGASMTAKLVQFDEFPTETNWKGAIKSRIDLLGSHKLRPGRGDELLMLPHLPEEIWVGRNGTRIVALASRVWGILGGSTAYLIPMLEYSKLEGEWWSALSDESNLFADDFFLAFDA